MNKIEKAKANFEQIFGQGFFEVIPVETFKGGKLEAAYYGEMTIHLNTTGFKAEDLYHEAGHALDELLFSTQSEFAKFFKPFYNEIKMMNYFEAFLSSYEAEYKPSEAFAEAIAMAISNPDWELGAELITAVKELL